MKLFFGESQNSNFILPVLYAAKLKKPTLIYGEASTGKVSLAAYMYELRNEASLKFHMLQSTTNMNKLEPLLGNINNALCLADFEQWSMSIVDYISPRIFEMKAWMILTLSESKYESLKKFFSKYNIIQESFQLIYMPSLRERKDDLLNLARNVINEAARKYKLIPKNLSRGAKDFILTYPWYGNFHEFNTVLMKGFFNCKTDLITEQDLQSFVKMHPESRERSVEDFENYLREILREFKYADYGNNQKLYSIMLEEADKVFIKFAMQQTLNLKKACQYLGISANTFRKKYLKHYNAK